LSAWERYEKQRTNFYNTIEVGNEEYKKMKKLYCTKEGKDDYSLRSGTVESLKISINQIHNDVLEANSILEKLLGNLKRTELAEEVNIMSQELRLLQNMEDKLQLIKSFNTCFASYQGDIKQLESWLEDGRKRLDFLLKPDKDLLPEERVMMTMELQSDIEQQIIKMRSCEEIWSSITPESEEVSDFSQNCVIKQNEIIKTLQDLLEEVKKEGEKFGEDVKHLADFASSQKKFLPWIAKAEEKKTKGLKKPSNLNEARELLTDAENWKKETESMKTIIDDGYDKAKKMTLHDEPDQTYMYSIEKWSEIETTCNEWISKLESMVAVWQKQAETAQKVTAAIAATPNDSSEMKLEDLEEHLNSLRQMFIDKQKMMDNLDKK